MTIDEALSHLHTYSSTMGSGQTTQAQHENAKRVAIETMRKYQQIEQIIDNWTRPEEIEWAIREVIDDGQTS